MIEILTLLSRICTLGAVGGYEQGMYGFGGFIIRFVIFGGLTVLFGEISGKSAAKPKHKKERG